MSVLAGLNVKQDGILADLLQRFEEPDPTFEIQIEHLTIPFRMITDYSELQDLTDRATDFEGTLRKGIIPTIPKELIPSRPGVAAQAQYLASVCAHAELCEPLPWLVIAKKAGPIFERFVIEVDRNLSMRARRKEAEAIEEKKGRSRRTRRSGTA